MQSQIISIWNRTQQIIQKMKIIIFLALLCSLALQQTVVVLSSSPANTVITSPVGLTVGVDPYHNATHLNFIGSGAQWLWQSGGASWPDGQILVFQTQFYAACNGTATLAITADNIFSAILNGVGTPMTGNDWTKKYTFNLSPLKCGKNTLVINVINRDCGSPAALIFSVSQDQSNCFNCQTSLSFFNRKSCQCECNEGFNCASTNNLYVWQAYPICGWRCGVKAKCRQNNYFDENSCSCQCIPKACPQGFEQDQTSCECRKSRPKCNLELIRYACQPNQVFDINACQCVLKCPIFIRQPDCPAGKQWSQDQCACVCLIQICLPPSRFDDKTCICMPNYYNNI